MADEQVINDLTRDNTSIVVTLPLAYWWLMVSGLQIASRHADMSVYVKGAWRDIAKVVEPKIIERHPDAEELIARGWDNGDGDD